MYMYLINLQQICCFFNVARSDYIERGWCMEEFHLAHDVVVNQGKKKFLIPVLSEDVNQNDLDPDLKKYISTHTYVLSNEEDLIKRIRYVTTI